MKPSEADARVLSSLFPSSASHSLKRTSSVFDPLDDCVATAQKRKKKAVHIKPRKVTVVLMHGETTTVPRFGKRRALKRDGNIRQLQFARSMSPQQVKSALFKAFSRKLDRNETIQITYMQPNPHTHTLTTVDKSDFDGGDVIDLAGQGNLYIRTELVEVKYDSLLLPIVASILSTVVYTCVVLF